MLTSVEANQPNLFAAKFLAMRYYMQLNYKHTYNPTYLWVFHVDLLT